MIQFPTGINAESFLRDYWQQQPLLIKQGLPGFVSPLEADELAGLALEEEIESRIVLEQGFDSPWELHQGPFDEEFFSRLPDQLPWTLLVQAVDLWVPEVHQIMAAFSFLPRWRMDDIMVSYANDGGSVGPHFDYYDVFLLQGQGRRHWSIGDVCGESTPLYSGTTLKILESFSPRESWVLEPGDILYLPPCVAHHGVADGECLTYSLGFRSPTAGEMLDDLATEVISHGGGGYYRDPPLKPRMASDIIDPAFIEQARELLLNTLNNPQLLSQWFATYMTRGKYPSLENDPDIPSRRAMLAENSTGTEREFINGFEQEND